jgi:hypothetical protein
VISRPAGAGAPASASRFASLGVLLAGVGHPLVSWIQRMAGGGTIAAQIAAAQAHKR